ncbi:hypothetical protein FSP39_009362 [Pinctada imbricata]|uniref:DUF3456 domain-containing protein n=1 Tax=Pinctada imbricata TaxID=66713 RepID=A0AA88XZX8_PINIB|nr:hypothetical protein FSP39_009362 [Pinctada imbricata]
MIVRVGLHLLLCITCIGIIVSAQDDRGVELPSLCEVCKFFVTELKERLEETGKSKEVLSTGHGLERKKTQAYKTSELRLIEATTDPHICDKILKYNVHKERKGSNRFAKGRSETMDTLHGLVNKGVKVELGIPYELWDEPSVEITDMQRKCNNMAERYEDDIEDWYYNYQDKDLMKYLCVDRVLRKDDTACLYEKPHIKGENNDDEENDEDDKDNKKSERKKSKKELKGDTGDNQRMGKTSFKESPA